MTSEEQYTERVYIDPERLLRLKRERKPLKLVPSIFEPPLDPPRSSEPTSRPLKLPPTRLESESLGPEILRKAKHPNIEFVVSLLGEIGREQVVELQEGDCFNLRGEDRWLLLEGEVKVVGVNGVSYRMGEGYFFFLSAQTKLKVREVVCLRGSKALRVGAQIYDSFLKNYVFLKNAEKIKYLKYCPFLVWGDHLSEDIAACMDLVTFEREETVYRPHNQALSLYFVKEGIVLLERSQALNNRLIGEYESHYEKNDINESEATLIVKKGMVFGLDGILLKEIELPAKANPVKQQPQEQSVDGSLNPEAFEHYQQQPKRSTRVYCAKTIGRTELYSVKKEVLETLFNLHDMLQTAHFPRELTKGDLQRICSDYADMVVRHRSLPKITQALVRKDMVLNEPAKGELQLKKTNVQRIRFHEEAVKKLSIAHLIADRRAVPRGSGGSDLNASLLHQLTHKLALSETPPDPHPLAFPLLSASLRKRKQPPREEAEKAIFQLLKSQQIPVVEIPKRRESPSRRDKLCLINVRSYRNIIAPLG